MGFVLPPIIVRGNGTTEEIASDLKTMFYGTGAVTAVLFVLVIICTKKVALIFNFPFPTVVTEMKISLPSFQGEASNATKHCTSSASYCRTRRLCAWNQAHHDKQGIRPTSSFLWHECWSFLCNINSPQ